MLKDLFGKKKYAKITLYKNDNIEKEILDNNGSINGLNASNKNLNTSNKSPKNSTEGQKNSSKQISGTPKVGQHPRIGARERIEELIDKDTFVEYDADLKASNPLDFPNYTEKVAIAMQNSGENEAIITGEGKLMGQNCIICVMDSNFMMGSMGSVVGEKITRAIEKAIEKKFPVIIFSASGGARMQEGILSLMQMAKTSAALGRLAEEGLLYISVLTDPTTGGVTASFAMLGDIIIAEPGALIGFAGPRVIEQTIRQKLPDGFQRAEFLQAKGFIDKIVSRKDMRTVLSQILKIHTSGGEINE